MHPIQRPGKIVRDKVIEIMHKEGESPDCCELTQEEFKFWLPYKVVEELMEFVAARVRRSRGEKLRELADLFEACHALRESEGFSEEEIEQARKIKARTKGRFARRLFLFTNPA